MTFPVLLAALTSVSFVSDAGGPVGRSFAIGALDYDQVRPSVAYDHERQEYLVVWHNEWPGNKDIYGQRVARKGTPVGPWFAISFGPDNRYNPDVTFNHAANEYLVVWEHEHGVEYSVRAQRVSISGQLMGSEITVAQPVSWHDSFKSPAVAYASTSGKYLVVWERRWEFGVDVLAQCLYDNGTPEGPPNLIASATGAGDDCERPDVAYNHRRNEYLVAWQRRNPVAGDYDIYARRVQGNGTPLFPESIQIMVWEKDQIAPAVAAIPTAGPEGQYLIVWEHRYAPTDGNIIMQRVAGSGSLLGELTLVTGGPDDETNPAVAGNESSQRYLVVWSHAYAPPVPDVKIFASSVSPEGQALRWGLLEGVTAHHAALASGPLGDVLVAYDDTDMMGTNRDIRGLLWGTRIYLPTMVRGYR